MDDENDSTPQAPQATTPYDYNTAQQLLQQKYALAQALMGTQMPDAGQINHANIGGNSYSFYIPNKMGMVSAALQKVLGAYELGQVNKGEKADVANQNAAIKQALASLNPTVSGETDSATAPDAGTSAALAQLAGPQGVLPPTTTPTLSPGSAPAGAPVSSTAGLSTVNPTAQYQAPTVSGPSNDDYLSAIMQLERSGPMGQGIGNSMMQRMYAQPKLFQNPKTGAITAVNPYTGQQVGQTVGGGGVDPELAPTLLKQLQGATYSDQDPNSLQYGNRLAQQLAKAEGLPPPPPMNAAQLSAVSQNPTVLAKIGQTQARTGEAQAQTAAIPQRTAIAAQNAGTAAAAQHTQQVAAVQPILGSRGTAQQEKVALDNLDNNLANAETLAKGAGRYGSVAGSWGAWSPGGPTAQAQLKQQLDAYLSQAKLQLAAQESVGVGGKNGRAPTAQLLQALEDGQITSASAPSAIMAVLGPLRHSLQLRSASLGGEINGYNASLKSLGYVDPPQAPAPAAGPAPQGPAGGPPLGALKAGTVTHFGNGQSWTIGPNGQPQQVQ